MPRKPREEAEDAIHHVYSRGNRRQAIFFDDTDRVTYLAHLARVIARKRWRCLAYCLMSNHMHLLIQTPGADLGIGMQRLQSVYAQTFNERHGIDGHLFQGRYGSERVKSDAQLVTTLRYIALNPVEAGLCADARDWRWSSYALLVEGIAPAWVDRARVAAYVGAWGAELGDLV